MIVSARPATLDELELIAAMADAAIDELEPRRGGAVWANTDGRRRPVRDGLAAEVAAPDAEVLVGTIDEAPVGYAAVHTQPMHDGSAIARITDLYVLPDARKVGVGEAMILAIEGWARERQLAGLDSLALPGDRDTKNFFETFGLVARAIEVHRSLEP
ncbi:MAG: GNAT family N-acetyltransferase [Actinomycetota bacterium]